MILGLYQSFSIAVGNYNPFLTFCTHNNIDLF